MDKLTGINLSVDKVIIQFVIPGFLGLFPYFLLIKNLFPALSTFLIDHEATLITSAVFSSLILGLVVESIGSYVEVYYFDKQSSRIDQAKYDELWLKYLDLQFDTSKEPIRIRYVRNLLFKMKFELSLGISMGIFAIGLAFLEDKIHFCGEWWRIILLEYILLGATVYLIFVEAWNSSKVIAKQRQYLVDRFWTTVPPNKGFSP